MNDNESGTPFEDFLRSILGDEAAAEAARALEAQGFDPANLPPEFSDPARMKAASGTVSVPDDHDGWPGELAGRGG